MRCDCCDHVLSDLEATAKYKDGRFVNMCAKCRTFLPKDVKVIMRRDLEKTVNDDESITKDEQFNFKEYYGDQEDD